MKLSNLLPSTVRKNFPQTQKWNLKSIKSGNRFASQFRMAFFQISRFISFSLQVPSESLNGGDVPSLMTLSLRRNSFTIIRSRSFHRLTFLQKLDLSENKIQALEHGAFEGLGNLQRIYLHANRISNLDSRDLPPSLHGITLHDNRSVCWFSCNSYIA